MQQAYSITAAPCAQAWGSRDVVVRVAGGLKEIADDEIAVVYQATIDEPGDLAYHTVLDGRPYCVVLAPEGMSLGDVEIAGDHEVKETIGDPLCDQWVFLPNGKRIAREICDPVQEDARLVDLGDGGAPVRTSDWVKPAWFDLGSTSGPYDVSDLINAPLSVREGGYAMLVTPEGATQMIGAGPAAFKRHPAFRHGRRLAQAHHMASALRLR